MPTALLDRPTSVGRAARARQQDARALTDPQQLITDIRSRAAQLTSLTPRELTDRADDLRGNLHNSRSFDFDADTLTAAFSLVCEAAKRTIGIEFYDVQLQAGLILASESIAEMKTGEGKTYAAVLPAFLYSFVGRGVHVATANAYLAKRDCEMLKPLYEVLGATVGLVESDATAEQKRAAYSCDVTFAAGSEFGFDYLRDQVVLRQLADQPLGTDFLRLLRGTESGLRSTLQRPLAASIVDEIDNVLIDDACSPLLLSMDSDRPAEDAAAHIAARQLADRLTEPEDILIDRAAVSVRLTEKRKLASVGERRSTAAQMLAPPLDRLHRTSSASEIHLPPRCPIRDQGPEGRHRRCQHRPIVRGTDVARRSASSDRSSRRSPNHRREVGARANHSAKILSPVSPALRSDRHCHRQRSRVSRRLSPERFTDSDASSLSP